VDRHYASQLGTGAIAVLNYGDKLFRVPMVVLTTSLFTVSLSYFAGHTVAEDFSKFRESLSVGLRFAAFLLVPTGLFMLIFRYPIISIAYQRGAFTLQDSKRVAATLVFFAPLVIVHGIWYVLERSMIALGRLRLLTAISMLTIAAKIATSAMLYQRLGVAGLVLSTVVTFSIAMVIMYGVILASFGPRAAFSDAAGIGHLLLAVAGSGGVGLVLRSALVRDGVNATAMPGSALILVIAGGCAIVTFFLLAGLMRMPEMVLVGRWLYARVSG
jgi:putative peptidoglycan lipid II flippase